MKNIKKVISVVLLTLSLCLCFMLGGCSKVEGVYKFDSLKYSEGGVTVEAKAGEDFMGVTLEEDFVVLTLEEDGTAKIEIPMSELDEEGTWTKEDSKTIVLKFEGEEVECTIDGKYLIGEFDGMELKLVKD